MIEIYEKAKSYDNLLAYATKRAKETDERPCASLDLKRTYVMESIDEKAFLFGVVEEYFNSHAKT